METAEGDELVVNSETPPMTGINSSGGPCRAGGTSIYGDGTLEAHEWRRRFAYEP